MTKWENLKDNPPLKNCNICIKIGQSYETFQFVRYSSVGWGLFKDLKEIEIDKIPSEAFYINLDKIQI